MTHSALDSGLTFLTLKSVIVSSVAFSLEIVISDRLRLSLEVLFPGRVCVYRKILQRFVLFHFCVVFFGLRPEAVYRCCDEPQQLFLALKTGRPVAGSPVSLLIEVLLSLRGFDSSDIFLGFSRSASVSAAPWR